MVAYEQRFFHRTCRYPVVLKKENIDNCYCYNCKNQSINPFDKSAILTIALFPESPVNLFCDINVKNNGKAKEKPIIAYPYNKKNIND